MEAIKPMGLESPAMAVYHVWLPFRILLETLIVRLSVMRVDPFNAGVLLYNAESIHYL